jgi:hypothetical protein
MRASDADRDRVLDVLRSAAGEGRLTPEEFDERMAATLAARTLGDLAALTADLPAGPGAVRPDVLTDGWPDGRGASPETAPDLLRIDQRYGSLQRTGRWVLPIRIELQPSWCDVTLDLTEAVLTADTLAIDMNMRGGSLLLVIAPGMIVTADALTARYTDLEISSGVEPGVRPMLRIELAGKMRYGWIGTRRVAPGT